MAPYQRPSSSPRDGDPARVSFPKVGDVGDGTGSSSPRGAGEICPPKNVNFSLFLRPTVLRAAGGGRCSLQELPGCNSGLARKVVGMDNDAGGTPRQSWGPDEKVGSKPSPADEELNKVSRYVEATKKPGPVERLPGWLSVRGSSMEEKGMRFRRQTCDPHVPAPAPACSQGASNDPGVPLKRTYEDIRSSSQSGTDSESETEDSERTERSSRPYARQASVYNSYSEKRRRGRVDKKLRVLQELLPNCNQKKADQVAVLDEAIDYLQTLQRQLQVLSTGSPMYMSAPMMLSTGIQQMYAPYLNQFPAVNLPRGVNTGAGVGCGGIQFPISHYPRTPTPSLGSGILGLQSMAHFPPFIASFGQPSAQSLSTQAPPTDPLDSVGQPGSGDSA